MQIVIAGDGEVGLYVAELLARSNHTITVIDPTENIKFYNQAQEKNFFIINANPTLPQTLIEAQIKKADLFIAVMHNEEPNIISASLAKHLGAKTTIARISTEDYLKKKYSVYFHDMGINYLVCPEALAVDEISKLLLQTSAHEIYEFASGKFWVVFQSIDTNSPMVGKRVDELDPEKTSFLPLAVFRKGKTFIAQNKTILEANDLVYFLVIPSKIDDFLSWLGQENYSIKNVMIVGGGRIGRKVAANIQDKINTKLIDIDEDRCSILSQMLQHTLIIHGDARDVNLLKEENIQDMDAFIAVTDSSETNILTCLLAREYGAKKYIPLLESVDYINIAQNIGIHSVINKKLITAGQIVKYTMGQSLSTIKCLVGIDAEVMEFIVQPKSRVANKKIEQLSLPRNCILGGLVRDDVPIIVSKDIQILPNDQVIVLTLPDAIEEVQEFFN